MSHGESTRAAQWTPHDSSAASERLPGGLRCLFGPRGQEGVDWLSEEASLAQQERKLISERTKAALARCTKKLGMAGRSKAERKRISALGVAAKEQAAMERLHAQRPQIEFALKGGATLRRAAETLNERGVESPMGGRWHAPSLLKAARRLGLR